LRFQVSGLGFEVDCGKRRNGYASTQRAQKSHRGTARLKVEG
jgi:hypothetical protein